MNKGVKDLNDKTLRCINSFSVTFDGDPSRFLRAIRFCCSKGFQLEDSLKDYLHQNAKEKLINVDKLKLWSISKELSKMVKDDKNFINSIMTLMRMGLIMGQEEISNSYLEKSKN